MSLLSEMDVLALESQSNSSYRWYLCVQQTNTMKWDCVRKATASEALNPFFYGERPTTKAIPISKWQPKLLDPLVLHYSLHPKVSFKM